MARESILSASQGFPGQMGQTNYLTASHRECQHRGMNTMTAAQIAAADQAQAKVRNQDRYLHNAALLFVWVFFSLGVYSWLAATGNAPAMPWSPIGQVQQQDHVPSPPSHLPSQKHTVEV